MPREQPMRVINLSAIGRMEYTTRLVSASGLELGSPFRGVAKKLPPQQMVTQRFCDLICSVSTQSFNYSTIRRAPSSRTVVACYCSTRLRHFCLKQMTGLQHDSGQQLEGFMIFCSALDRVLLSIPMRSTQPKIFLIITIIIEHN